jgi:hypothetical protein
MAFTDRVSILGEISLLDILIEFQAPNETLDPVPVIVPVQVVPLNGELKFYLVRPLKYHAVYTTVVKRPLQ